MSRLSPSHITHFTHVYVCRAKTTSRILHNVSSLDGRITIYFAFGGDIHGNPIFRHSTWSIEGEYIDILEASFGKSILR